MTDIVDVWVDPVCPYTWAATRWLLEAARVRPLELRWRLLSLAALNEGRDDDPEGDPEGYLWLPARVCAAAEEHAGHDGLGRFHLALGARVHERGEMDERTIPAALADAGLPAALAAAAGSDERDDAVRASTAAGLRRIGGDIGGAHVGTPIVAVGGTAFFGPVLSRIPRGEDAGRLWDGTLLVAGTAGFHELKGRPHAAPGFA
ncbi:mycothiol-dependent nitroreductase Rv2466c family protein [Actinomadura sp. WAC 06369]|uniref:mycothiol-dependent nitroreductase Rv2466c family protein n=1 Tax=Actinomadura sp. WAC 06369 TaxID=2203193 RepID=UPI000F76B45B|nr:disulfide bond formation protein DsbA [Actinomadura sp. WAC 06369]RSN68276.1 disulfide bond formation protein DsbA [Actinomadura sp. WAC 06369]